MMTEEAEIIDLILASVIRRRDTTVSAHILTDGKSFKQFAEESNIIIEQRHSSKLQKKPHKQNEEYILYKCDRGRKSRGKVPKKAVGCKFYVSYEKKAICNRTVVVETLFPLHNGHSEEDHQFSSLDVTLLKEVKKYVALGVKNDVILSLAHSWAQEHGHMDPSDRRFYITPEEISEIKRRVKLSSCLDRDDATSTSKLLETEFQNETVFYQKLDRNNDRPLIIVLQAGWMKSKMESCGRNLVFMDATHNVTQYGFSLYAICVRDEFGFGVPVAFMILSCDSDMTLTQALSQLKLKNPSFNPRAFMVDKDVTEWNAIGMTFKHSRILLCWFHVTQAIYRWLCKAESGIGGPKHVKKRLEIIDQLRKLKLLSTEEEFSIRSAEFLEDIKQENIRVYLEENWIAISEMWADYGRKFYHEEAETNNLAERFFLRIKQQFLGMNQNRRVDRLVLVLLGDVCNYFVAKENLLHAGRIRSRRHETSNHIQQKAKHLLAKGWLLKIKKVNGGAYHVPSEYGHVVYITVPAEQFCSCAYNQSGGRMCKHLHLLFLISVDDPLRVPNKEFLKLEMKQTILDHRLYKPVENSIDEYEVTCPGSGQTYLVKITSNLCTCNHFAHFGECACIDVIKSVAPTALSLIESASPLEDDEESARSFQQVTDDVPDQAFTAGEANFVENEVSIEEKLRRLLDHAKCYPVTSPANALVTKAYDLVFGKFVGQTKKRKMHVLNPNREHKAKMCKVKRICRTSEDIKRDPKVKSQSRRKSLKTACTESGFVKVSSRATTRKRRKGHQIYGSNKRISQEVISIGNNLKVPVNIHEFLKLQKERTTCFPRVKSLQILYINGIMERLGQLYNFVPENAHTCRTELITFFQST